MRSRRRGGVSVPTYPTRNNGGALQVGLPYEAP
jgi:hypothetical protein